MKITKCISLFTLIFLFFSAVFAQDVLVQPKDGSDAYYRTRPNETVNDNYSTKGNVNPYTGKAGTKAREYEAQPLVTGAPGTGEYFLVPAIVRTDPTGTAVRFNTCGTALMSLMDKGTIYNLTDKSKQYFTPEVVLSVAESRFRKASEYVPNNYLYHLNLGVVLYRQRRFTEAVEEINRAIELNPNDMISQNYKDVILREKVTVRIIEERELP